ncbi:MAG: hypothetical protein Crog4KO_18310 [Crocinitomicaceae bacterium]
MDPEITKLIDQYLSGTLSSEQLADFQKELAQSVDLQNEVALQQSIMQAAERAAQRNTVKDAARAYKRKRMLRNGGFSALIALVVASTLLFFSNRSEVEKTPQVQEMAPISLDVKMRLDNNQDFSNIPIQYFQIPSQGSVQLSSQGVLISVPEKAFLKDGKPFVGNVILQYQEAIRGIDIVTSGLSTMTGDDLLETQGMFSVTGYTEDGKPLQFNPEVGVYLQAPVDDCKTGMQLYDGKKLDDGSIDWVNPKPLSKIPTVIDMSELDFYPEGYEDHLDSEKWKRDKHSRDSLYLSLEHSMDLQAIADAMNNGSTNGQLSELSDQYRETQFGAVYGKRTKPGDTIPSIDNLIAWDFTCELLGNDIWEITATAVIRPGFHVYGADNENPKMRTEIKSSLPVVEETRNVGQPVKVRTKDGVKNGFVRTASFKKKVEMKTASQISVPVRVIFKVGNDRMDYAHVIRRSNILIGQSPEQRTARIDSLVNVKMNGDFILPSNVMSMWKEAFNNTNLSTREFEARMKAIHQTCDNEVLALYVENLDLPISEIDRKVVKMGYPEFRKFADQNVGKVAINDPHLEGLIEFYGKATNALRKDARNEVKSAEERMKLWNSIVNNQRELDRSRAAIRNQQYVDGMKNFNRKNLVRQFRNSNGFRITSGSFGSPTARVNCDRWRPFSASQLSQADTSTQIYFVENESKFNPFSVTVDLTKEYIDVYMYVFADGINSYQRLKGENGMFECQMNNEIKYAIGIVALTESGYAYYEHDFLKGGDLGTVKLKNVSEEYLEARIEKMNGRRLVGETAFKDDLKWLRTQHVNYRIQNVHKEMVVFRRATKSVIFPCVTFVSDARLSAEAIIEEEAEGL